MSSITVMLQTLLSTEPSTWVYFYTQSAVISLSFGCHALRVCEKTDAMLTVSCIMCLFTTWIVTDFQVTLKWGIPLRERASVSYRCGYFFPLALSHFWLFERFSPSLGY